MTESPGRPLLVLDLDETLWHGQADPDAPGGVRFLLRPYLQVFLEEVGHSYDLAIWTSASEDWMHAGLRVIHEVTGVDLHERAFFLWRRERCTWLRGEDGEYAWRKRARKFDAKWIRSRYPRGRILVVDDLTQNYACGYGHLVKVSAWTGNEQDDELLVLAKFLRSIAHEADLRRLEKRGWRRQTLHVG